MVNPVKLFEGLLLPLAVAVQYTGPARVPTIIKKMTVTNNDAVNGHVVTVHICGSAISPSNATLVVDAKALGPLETRDLTELQGHIISGGGTLQAFADDATHVSAQAAGVQIA